MKERAAAAYAVKDKEVKASARADKWRWLNDLAEEAETAARNNCSGDLSQLNVEEVLERWREHFEEVLNVQRPHIPLPVIDQAPGVITSIDTGDISIAEIKRAIHRRKTGKSPGIVGISAELLKCSEKDAVKQLHLLINAIWKEQCATED